MPHFLTLVLVVIIADSIRAQEAGEIRGTVVDGLEKPVAGVVVRVQPSNGQGSPLIVRTGIDGRYRIQNLAPDTYDLDVSSSGFYSARIKSVQLGTAEVKVLPVVLLDVGLITG